MRHTDYPAGARESWFCERALDTPCLKLVTVRVRHDKTKRFFRVTCGPWNSRTEVLQRGMIDPGIMLSPGRHTLRHDIRGEELSQRGSDGFHDRRISYECHIVVAGESHVRQDRL